jgi:hypothetical protein
VVAKNRASRPDALRKFLRGDLDWIVMKCLEKDRRRRYGTASELVADIERYLKHEPVLATPPSRVYRVGKFVRRHRVGVAALGALAATVVLGACISTWLAIRATRAERVAQREAAKAEAINEFLIQDLLLQADNWLSDQPASTNVTLYEVVARAVAKIDGRFPNDPAVEAAVRRALGRVLNQLGRPAEATGQLRQAHERSMRSLGRKDPETLRVKRELGWSLSFNSLNRAEGEKLLREAYEGQLEVLGLESLETLFTAHHLALHYLNGQMPARAEEFLPQVAEVVARRQSPTNRLALDLAYSMAYLRQRQGRHGEAWGRWKELHARVLQSKGPESLWLANLNWSVGSYLWWWEGNHQAAAELIEQGLQISRRLVGTAYPTDALAHELMRLRLDQGLYVPAAEAARACVADLLASYAPDHPYVTWRACLAGSCFARTGAWEAGAVELAAARNRGVITAHTLASELLARLLAGDVRGAAEVRASFERWLREKPNQQAEGRTAWPLLSLAWPSAQTSTVVEFADHAAAHEVCQPTQRLLRGAAAYRRGNHEDARRAFAAAGDRMGLNPRIAALADYFGAMTWHRGGETERARELLRNANDHLERLLRPGDLGIASEASDPWGELPADEDWTALGACLVVRDEAERLILGGVVSARVTAASLAANRETWEPVRELLQTAHQAARRRDYGKARETYLEILQHPRFNFAAAGQQFPKLDQAMGAIFVLAGDLASYDRLCRDAFDPMYPRGGVSVESLLLHPKVPSAGIKLKALRLAEDRAAGADAATDATLDSARPRRWSWVLGAAHLRNDQPSQAREWLTPLLQADNHSSVLIATVLSAMAARELGEADKARQFLAQAERDWRSSLAAAEGRLSPVWRDEVVVELLLKEARQLIPD